MGDRIIEWMCGMGQAPQALLVNGQIAERSIAAEHNSAKSGDAWTEHESMALMVHPLDVKKYRADAHARGLNVTIRNNGMVHFDSRSDQKRYVRAYEYVNFDDT